MTWYFGSIYVHLNQVVSPRYMVHFLDWSILLQTVNCIWWYVVPHCNVEWFSRICRVDHGTYRVCVGSRNVNYIYSTLSCSRKVWCTFMYPSIFVRTFSLGGFFYCWCCQYAVIFNELRVFIIRSFLNLPSLRCVGILESGFLNNNGSRLY